MAQQVVRGRRAPDLVKRDFPAQDINCEWYGDGTKIPTDKGKLQLASVLDMGSRRILGFAQGLPRPDAGPARPAVAGPGTPGNTTEVAFNTQNKRQDYANPPYR